MFRLLENVQHSAPLVAAAASLAFLAAGAAGAAGRDPSFAPGAPITAGWLGAVADFNRDGKPDLAAITERTTAILLGDGARGFAPAGPPVQSGHLQTVGDFNGDGAPDLAVVNKSNELSVLLGNGAGGFSPAPAAASKLGGTTDRAAVADFNGDGKLDLVLDIYDGKKLQLSIFLGDGSGHFATAVGSPFAPPSKYVSSIAVADFGGDGTFDLAVGDSQSTDISILRGNGDGRFGAARKIPLPAFGTTSLAVGDFNRDRKADIVVGTQGDAKGLGPKPLVTILLGNGSGGFRRAAGSPIPVDGLDWPSAFAVADLDGNGVPDLAVAAEGIAVLLGNGKGGFRRAADSPFPVPPNPSCSVVCSDVITSPVLGLGADDFDGDGKVDLAVTGTHRVTIMLQTPPAPAAAARRAPSTRSATVFSTRGRVERLAADGSRVAAVIREKGACGRIAVWDAPRRRSTNFRNDRYIWCDSVQCTSGATCVDELALGAGQVAWITIAGGNSVELHLFAASASGGKVKEIDDAYSYDTGGGGYIGHLLGAGPLLAYNRWDVACSRGDPDDPDCDEYGLVAKKLVRVVAGRRAVVSRGGDSYPLTAVGGGRMAVVSDGAVTVRAAHGARLAKVAALEREPTRAIALESTRLAVERTFTLDLDKSASGKETKSIRLGPAAALELIGLSAKLALLQGSHRLVLVRLSDGKLISLPVQDVIDPALTDAGLFYAYNTPKAAMKGHIVFEPTAKLLRRF